MKIACIAYLHGFGGAERQIVMLANNLAALGHDVSLISLVANKSTYEISSKINFIDLSGCEKKYCKILNRYFILRKVMNCIKPDVSINFWLQSAYLCALMPKSVCGKIIYAERGDPGDKEYANFLSIIRWLSFKRIDGFVFQTKGARDFFGEKIRNRSIVIPNAHSVPEGLFTEICNQKEKKIISAGRLHPQKNQSLLIKAFASIAREIPDYNLEIYGEGTLYCELVELIKKLNMESRVFIYPPCKNLFEKLHKASLFVLSSDFEGMPNALMEAMVLGTPCISTDCKPGGARELIDDGVNGWIVPRNDVVTLAERIRYVLKECADSQNIAQKATKIRISHSVKEIYDMWNNVVCSIANKGRK